jgi:hypothetical protein
MPTSSAHAPEAAADTGNTFTWTGAVSSDWATAGNWNPAGVPGANDSVVINENSRVASLAGEAIVRRATINRLGALSGAGTLTVTEEFVANDQVALGGAGTLRIAAGATARVASTTNNQGALTLNDTRRVENAGTFTLVGRHLVNANGNSTFANSGTIELQGDSRFNGAFNSGAQATVFVNTGTLRKTAGGADGSRLDFASFTNDGSIEVQAGTLRITGAGTSKGAFTIAAGATLNLFPTIGGTQTLTCRIEHQRRRQRRLPSLLHNGHDQPRRRLLGHGHNTRRQRRDREFQFTGKRARFAQRGNRRQS